MSSYNDEFDSLIILVDRGSCSFATKVYYGEMAGAGLVIIVNSENRMFDGEMFMIDDGNLLGTNIGIPSMMIDYKDGTLIEKSIQNPQIDTGNYTEATMLLATFDFVTSFQ